ncbi:MAG: polyphosphate kinase 2 [Alphaproteobacteria bacterium]
MGNKDDDKKKKTKDDRDGARRRDPKGAALRDFEFGEYPYRDRMDTKDYEEQLRLLQIELLKVQRWVAEAEQKVVAVFEGRDAAGKGGTIKRFMEHMNPRGARVVALLKPTERERSQWYFHRYVEHLPAAGEIALFDRSWYNRAGVEKVMGFCTDDQYREFLHQCPEFERMLVRSGLHLIKYWLTVTKDEQAKRFDDRQNDPLKQWKLSPIDIASRDKWAEYSEARDAMFDHTDTEHAPWTVIKSDDKKRARIACLRHFLGSLDYKDRDDKVVVAPDPAILRARSAMDV